MTALTPLTTTDPYAQRSVPVGSQARNAVAVTPSDTVDQPYKALYIGTTGDVTILPINATDTSQTVTFKTHPVGYMPVQVRRVMSTGTTASTIVGLTS